MDIITAGHVDLAPFRLLIEDWSTTVGVRLLGARRTLWSKVDPFSRVTLLKVNPHGTWSNVVSQNAYSRLKMTRWYGG